MDSDTCGSRMAKRPNDASEMIAHTENPKIAPVGKICLVHGKWELLFKLVQFQLASVKKSDRCWSSMAE